MASKFIVKITFQLHNVVVHTLSLQFAQNSS